MRVPFLFWNVGRRPLQASVARLVIEHGIRVVILAECDIDPELVLAEFVSAGIVGFTFPFSPTGATADLKIFLHIDGCDLQPIYDDPNSHVTIRRLVFAEKKDLLLVAVHAQSKLNFDEDSQTQIAIRLARKIVENEIEFNHRRTLLVGDLNMNPFEKGIVGSEGLHAVMTKQIAGKNSRIVDAEQRYFFYNPMWRFFGERSDSPPGTHYYAAGGKPISFVWNIYDQVMVRPDLIEVLEDVRILQSIGSSSLLNEEGFPDESIGSDHLPICFTLHIL